MECIRSKKFGLESYNNCLSEYKTAALDGKLFEKKFAAKPKSNVEKLETHTVRLIIFEQKSEDEFDPLGGGSGVIKSIPNNTKVMGYPAKDLKKFIKDNK